MLVSSPGAPLNWTSQVDGSVTAARCAAVHDPLRINLAVTSGQRAVVAVNTPTTSAGLASCTSYLGDQPLAESISQYRVEDVQVSVTTGPQPRAVYESRMSGETISTDHGPAEFPVRGVTLDRAISATAAL